jgi:chondroitin 4-sulfotransferase 11
MIISHKHKCIFIRTAKTGSTSILNAFNPHRFEEIYIPGKSNLVYIEGKEYDSNHLPLPIFKKLFLIDHGEDLFDEYFKFSFVRNPWDRIVSAWKYNIKHGYTNGNNQATILRFINHLKFGKSINSYKYLSQYDFVNGCDFIGKVENIQADFNFVCDKIGIPQQQLPHKNKTNHKHYTEYYDDETREIVAKNYARDIEYFGYKFGD